MTSAPLPFPAVTAWPTPASVQLRKGATDHLTGLGATPVKSAAAQRHVDGLLDVMADAVDKADAPLTDARLQGWQAALFPDGYSGLRQIRVGAYRSHAEPMQIVSGPVGREKVHYEAPASAVVPTEMAAFLAWVNDDKAEPYKLVKAALA